MVTWFDGFYALANRLDDTSTLMTKYDGESTFGVFAGECIGIYTSSAHALFLSL